MQSDAGFSEMRHMICGFSITIAIAAVTELGIVDRLTDGPKSAALLATATGADADALQRVMCYLASEGVFDESGDTFALNDRSQWLRADVPGSLRPRAIFAGSALNWTAWGSFLQSVRTGESSLQAAFGKSLFEYLKGHAADAATFNTFMADQTAASVGAILAAFDFTGVREFVDVGGGRGALVSGVLQAYPSLRGVLFDLPQVIATAAPALQQAGVADRCKTISGSFFEGVPANADLYALKFVLHDWPDAECIRILTNTRQAMTADARLLVVEHAVPTTHGPHFAKFMDMNMLALTAGGRERTEAAFARLLTEAGLTLRRTVPTAIDIAVLECTAA
jgi:hypothetical protein